MKKCVTLSKHIWPYENTNYAKNSMDYKKNCKVKRLLVSVKNVFNATVFYIYITCDTNGNISIQNEANNDAIKWWNGKLK